MEWNDASIRFQIHDMSVSAKWTLYNIILNPRCLFEYK